MRYVSTRGGAKPLAFDDVLLAGLAPDGGLYVPKEWPRMTAAQIADLAGRPYAEIAFRVLRPFVGKAIRADDLEALQRAWIAVRANLRAVLEHVTLADLRDGKLEPVLQGEQQVSGFDVSRAGALAAVGPSRVTVPAPSDSARRRMSMRRSRSAAESRCSAGVST